MKILLVHNHYQQRGGEDAVFKAEGDLLKRHGNEVCLFERSNAEINKLSFVGKFKTLYGMNRSRQTYEEVRLILKKFRPDVVHVYNTFFMVTAAVYDACCDENIPVVQSLYNYRLICANALFLKHNKKCEECMLSPRWHSIVYACYRNSHILTAFVVRMINQHWRNRVWLNKIDAFIVATDFSRKKFIEIGIPGEKIHVKPHFVYPDPQRATQFGKNYAFYVGRISVEKGVRVMLDAWELLQDSNIRLKIMGEGPELDKLLKLAQEKNLKQVEFLGFRPDEEYFEHLNNAKFVIVPSVSYDNFPRVIGEAFSCGVPVLGSAVEGIKEYVRDGVTGFLFEAGNPRDLADKVSWFGEASHQEVVGSMARRARQEYECKYTAERNYEKLIEIYSKVLSTRRETDHTTLQTKLLGERCS